jgi:hypothetical protein
MPSKVFSKGDMMENLPQKTSMGGGGMADSYKGPSAGAVLRATKIPQPAESSFGNTKAEKISRAYSMGIMAGGLGVSGKFAKDAYNFEKDQETKKRVKSKMADKPPKISPRKAYEE